MSHILFKPLLIATTTGSAVLFGNLLSLSYVSANTLLSTPSIAPSILLTQWKTAFTQGFHICPTTAILSGLIYFLNAFLTYLYPSSTSQYAVVKLIGAGAFTIGIVPYTLKYIVGVEEELILMERGVREGKMERKGLEGKEGEIRELIVRWRDLNYGRCLLPLLGVGVAWSIWW